MYNPNGSTDRTERHYQYIKNKKDVNSRNLWIISENITPIFYLGFYGKKRKKAKARF